MSFIWPQAFWLLPLIPLAIWAYRREMRARAARLAEWGSMGLLVDQNGRFSSRRQHWPPLLYLTGLSLLLLGATRPEATVQLPRVEGTVILAFDVSNSMAADDFEPTRIEAAKTAARRFVDNQPTTVRIGIVAFSNGGLVVQPPTYDRLAIFSAIDRLDTQGGTSLGQGIFTSLSAIAGEPLSLPEEPAEAGALASGTTPIGSYPSAVVVLLSDGENTSDLDPLQIAQLAAEAGVRIFPIGIGSPDGAVVEVEGFQILTQLNETPLEEIASLTNGSYFAAADEAALTEIYETIDLQLTVRGEKTEITSLFAAAGLLTLLLGALASVIWLGRLP